VILALSRHIGSLHGCAFLLSPRSPAFTRTLAAPSAETCFSPLSNLLDRNAHVGFFCHFQILPSTQISDTAACLPRCSNYVVSVYMGNCCGRAGTLSSVAASSVGSSSIDSCRRRGRRAGRSRGCRSGASPRPGVHATLPRLSHRWHYWVHTDGYLRLFRNGVLPERGPHVAASCDCSPFLVICTQRIIGDYTHHGRTLARGLRSHDNARGRVGDLRNAVTLARDHEAPSQNPVP
jgi:hypothetical protein